MGGGAQCQALPGAHRAVPAGRGPGSAAVPQGWLGHPSLPGTAGHAAAEEPLPGESAATPARLSSWDGQTDSATPQKLPQQPLPAATLLCTSTHGPPMPLQLHFGVLFVPQETVAGTETPQTLRSAARITQEPRPVLPIQGRGEHPGGPSCLCPRCWHSLAVPKPGLRRFLPQTFSLIF